MAYTGCDIIGSAVSGMINQMDTINTKIIGLKRLAELIEMAVDPRYYIPDINRLIPIGGIDLASYENLRAYCPMLNLPDAEEGLDKLRSDLNQAYRALIDSLNLHPLFQLNELVDSLNRLIGQTGIDYACVLNYLLCAEAACRAAGMASDTLYREAAIARRYGQNIANTTAAVLSDRARYRINTLNATIDQLRNLTQ